MSKKIKTLTQIRDEKAAKHTELRSKQMNPGAFIDGFNCAVEEMQKLSAEGFDQVECQRAFQKDFQEYFQNPRTKCGIFMDGARWQHSQNHARILALETELEAARKTLTSCKAAMTYAYEDRVDLYYLNTRSDIEKALTRIDSFLKGGKK